MTLLRRIKKAFSDRKQPVFVTPLDHPNSDIYSDAEHFAGRSWEQLTCNELEQYHDAIFGFTDEAFCYFFPGIMSAVVREGNPYIIMVNPIISELERLPRTGMVDEYLISRWVGLSTPESRATQQWVLWLSEKLPNDLQDPLFRAYEGLELLITTRI